MTRMFEEGLIAATDIISAYCGAAPDQQPWSDTIKRQREEAWCKEWGTERSEWWDVGATRKSIQSPLAGGDLQCPVICRT